MAGQMWFGTRGYMQWVPAPAVDTDFSKVGWSSQMQYLNGGSGVRSSRGSHKEYNLTWNIASRDALRPITDYSDGIYDSTDGINLIYFVDPMAADKNVAPQLWASPAQAAADGVELIPGQTAYLSATPVNSLGYPARSATFTANATSSSFWLPIPPGYTAWVGVHGSRTGTAGVQITPTSGLGTGTPVVPTMLAVTDSTLVNTSFDYGIQDGILVSLVYVGAASTNTVTLSGLVIQLLPTGATPPTGGFISGQGHSGVQFAEKPTQTPRSAVLDKVAMSARLIETGSWI